jgi:hypothetical protein
MFLLLALWWVQPVLAEDRAEYVRLAGEVQNLARRNAWAGVERAYVAALRTGESGTFDLHLAGAHAAWARGDVRGTRQRLQRAHAQQERRDVIEWMYRIDRGYGEVRIQVAPEMELERPASGRFEPEMAAAVAFAADQVRTTGRFSGLLPRGVYAVGPYRIDVADGVAVLEPVESARGARREPG